jgi:Ca2+-binding EF-hand superfamily protein/CRP-like cAMP-binding protein
MPLNDEKRNDTEVHHDEANMESSEPDSVTNLPQQDSWSEPQGQVVAIAEEMILQSPLTINDNENTINKYSFTEKSKEEIELIRLALHRNPYFTCMDEEQIERFIRVSEIRSFRAGEAVILEGCRDEREPQYESGNFLKESALADIDDLLLQEDDSQPDKLDMSTTVITEEGRKESKEMEGEKRILNNLSPSPFHLIPPPSSGSKPLLFVIKEGKADVLYDTNFNPASLGPGTLFGEGGFLFGRQHSASIVAAGPLECWVVDFDTFFNDVLKSENLERLFARHAHRKDNQGNLYMTMQDFIHSCLESEKKNETDAANSAKGLSIANAYNSILRSSALSQYKNNQIYLSDFCLFYLLISRPDPEVDIAFLLMDRHKTGSITKADFRSYLSNLPFYFDPESEFVQRHFGHDQTIRSWQFSQFLVDLQREMGRQAFLHRARDFQKYNNKDNNYNKDDGIYLPPEDFVDVLKSTCGWRLPRGVADRLESLYSKGAVQSAEATAMASVRAGTIKGDTPDQVADYSTRSVISDFEHRKNRLGTRSFTYVDYIAFQEVLSILPGIYNLTQRACEIKNGPISADDFKVANRVLGLGGRLSRRQVDIIFQLFDLDRDGYISAEDTYSVCGLENAYRLEAVTGRKGKLTFAPPPKHKTARNPDTDEENLNSVTNNLESKEPEKPKHLVGRIMNEVTQFVLSSVAGGIGIATVYRKYIQCIHSI